MVKVIKVKEKDSDCISTIRHHDGFMGQRIGPVNSMSFHPHRVSPTYRNSYLLLDVYGKRLTSGTSFVIKSKLLMY